ncbi:hypothetical protein TSUD_418630, partial [Trifolium subterraneum]
MNKQQSIETRKHPHGVEPNDAFDSSKKIAWVSWGKVCKSKSDGGLGVRDLRAVNLALLGKWRWRLISGGVGLWRDIILARHGSLFPSPHLGGRLKDLKRVSCWWRNVSLLGDPEDAISNCFSYGVSKKSTSTVREMGRWVEGQWIWDLRTTDSWCWKHDPSGCYSVQSAFLALSRSTTNEVIFSVEEHRLLPKAWKTWSPSKVAVFSWQLLQHRLPTRQYLWHRGVIGDASASMCVLCGLGPESADHLFGSCNQISPI